ncbi:hypothetical protein BHE90_004820, partial [Fusarium euwallaceae]
FNSEVREAQQHVARKTKLFYQHANNFSNAVKTETEKYPPSVKAKVREKSQELKGTLGALNRVRDDPPSQQAEMIVMGRVLDKIDKVVKAFGNEQPVHNPGGGVQWIEGYK